MIPTWVAVVAGISLGALALAAIAIAVASALAVVGVRAFLRVLEALAGPALGDVRQLVATIRAEAEGLGGTSQELRGRILAAADRAAARLNDLDAVIEVVEEEVRSTGLDRAATPRTARRSVSLLGWGHRAVKPRRTRSAQRGRARSRIASTTPRRTTCAGDGIWRPRRPRRRWPTANGRGASRPTWAWLWRRRRRRASCPTPRPATRTPTRSHRP